MASTSTSSDEENKAMCDCKSVEDCKPVLRMIDALKYYQTLRNDVNSKTGHEQFTKYCNVSYESLLNDYTHIIMDHNDNDLSYMTEILIKDQSFIKCDGNNCECTSRYFADRNANINNEKQDLNYIFYRNIMDQIHCHVLHLWEMGMRVKPNTPFANIRNTLKQQLNVLHANNINDGQHNNNNKYNIDKDKDKDCKSEEITFLDGLYDDMRHQKISKQTIRTLQHKLNADEYDSDSVQSDAEFACSNIANYLENRNVYNCIKRYIYLSTIYQFSFNTGYTFYYWDYYKTPSNSLQPQQKGFFANRNDHCGYTQNELYVAMKYKNVKEELLQNGIFALCLTEFTVSMQKANQLITTNRAKHLKSECPDLLYYNIEDETPLSVFNILAILLYTDWTDLSSAFTSTFRKKVPYESISSVKERNAEFANWSKLLRESIQLFGQQGYDGIIGDEDDEMWNEENNRVRGPFYCGMSIVLTVPECNIKLCGPTSTSKQIEVATRFAARDGILLKLNNYGYTNSALLKTFGCAWLSNFSLEDEWLFVGGHFTIRIQSITIIDPLQDFEAFFEPLFYFDCAIKGNDVDDDLVAAKTNKAHRILTQLIRQNLKVNQCESKYDKYVTDTFECFVNSRREVVINLEFLNKKFLDFKDLLITENNVIKAIIFDLFKSCKHLIIYATDSFGDEQYEFDLLALLSVIKSKYFFIKSHNVQIRVIGSWEYYEQASCSWIKNIFSPTLQSMFNGCNYRIEIHETVRYDNDADCRKEDHLVINAC